MTPRSKPARDRLLAAARIIFAEHGYEGATVRAIASKAQVTPSMIIRYFGSKEGLFAAALNFDLRIPELASESPPEAGAALVQHFLRRWDEEHRDLEILLRASFSHADARERMRGIFEDQLMAAISRICGVSRARQSAALVTTQMLGLAYTRYVLKLPAVGELAPEVLIGAVGRTIAAYLEYGSEDHP